jgi:hypothetical protein
VSAQRSGILQADGSGGAGQLDGVVAERAQARLQVGLPVVVSGVVCQVPVCALGTEVVCVRLRSVVAVVVP